ncbi:MAG TPA: hypothetical protein VHE13_03675 [Opitutus sp.]|nr:hypothetical protein [Opitutus sp.]
MKTRSLLAIAAALFCLGLVNSALAVDAADSVVTAVFSRSFNDYERRVRADGSPEVQTYIVARGGYAPGTAADASIDDVKFAGIVRILGKHLAKQGYYPAKHAGKADLVLVVHWGKTVPFNDAVQRNVVDEGLRGFAMWQQIGGGVGASPGIPADKPRGLSPDLPGGVSEVLRGGQGPQLVVIGKALEEAAQEEMVQGMFQVRFAEGMRYAANERIANLLGYTAELQRRANPSLYAGAGTGYYDLLTDLESERYYVAVTAYDFQAALQHSQKKGLWRTVASVDARGNRFDEKLTAMVDKASRYFGRDSGRLVRQFEYAPHVSFGDLEVLGVVDQSSGTPR